MQERAPNVKTGGPMENRIARDIGDVSLRFEPYSAADPPFDIYWEIYSRLGLSGDELIVDVGAHDGNFIFWLKDRMHKGELIGIEPQHSVRPNIHNQRRVRFYEYFAQHLPGANNSVDVLTANFMMYFVPEDEQLGTLQEFKRVLKPSGKLVLSTSGDFNKVRHRIFEKRIADKLGVKKGAPMNETFDSKIATQVLPGCFKNVYHVSYHGKMVFRSEEEAVKYYHSMMSMRRTLIPPVSEERFHEAYMLVVAPIVSREIAQLGQFEDYIERDFFICNDDNYGMDVSDPISGRNIIVNGYIKEAGSTGAQFRR